MTHSSWFNKAYGLSDCSFRKEKKDVKIIVNHSFSWHFFSLLLRFGRHASRLGSGVVHRGQQHGDKQQQRHQQVRSVDRRQQPALLQRLGTGVDFRGGLIEEDVSQNRDQCGGHVCGIHDGWSPDPPTTTWKTRARRSRDNNIISEPPKLNPLMLVAMDTLRSSERVDGKY